MRNRTNVIRPQTFTKTNVLLFFLLVATVEAGPTITAQPQNVTSMRGGDASFQLVVGASGSNLLQDGGFEDATNGALGAPIPNWSNSGNDYAVQGRAQGIVAIEGVRALVFNPANTTPNATVSQTFTTTPGVSYQVSFQHGVLGRTASQSILVQILNGTTQLTSRFYSMVGNGTTTISWQRRSFTFQATGTSTTISVQDTTPALNGQDEDQLIDDVKVVQIGGNSTTYQWYRSPSTLLSGETNSRLNISNVQAAASYYCVATDSTGATQSNSANLTILPALGIDRGTGSNPHYFTDGKGNSVYLTGVHRPNDLQDWYGSTMSYDQFVSDMVSRNQNLILLWCQDQPFPKRTDGQHAAVTPQPFLRVSGSGIAQDGGNKFDLSQFDDAGYFARLAARVKQAGSNGIYAVVRFSTPIFAAADPSNFRYSMYRNATVGGNPGNNVNSNMSGLTDYASEWTMTTAAWSSATTYAKGKMVSSGGSLYQSLQNSNTNNPVTNTSWWANVSSAPNNVPDWVTFMDAYVDKVVDTVNQYDNVLYDVGVEGFIGTSSWQDHVIDRIHAREASKPKQHPVGKSAFARTNPAGAAVVNSIQNDNLLASPADFVGFSGRNGPAEGSPPLSTQLYVGNVPDAPTNKVSVLDTDHTVGYSWASQSSTLQQWVWKCLTRGHNPVYVDPGFGWPGDNLSAQNWIDGGDTEVMKRLGWAHALADRCHLRMMTPDDAVSDTTFALKNSTWQYLIYQPNNAPFHVTLPSRTFNQEWIDPNSGNTISKSTFTAAAGSGLFDLPSGYTSGLLYLEDLHITSIVRRADGNVILQGEGIPGVGYFIEASPDPSTTPFTTLTSVTADAAGTFSVQDNSTAGRTRRFYRVRANAH